jgi:hypothetical protein
MKSMKGGNKEDDKESLLERGCTDCETTHADNKKNKAVHIYTYVRRTYISIHMYDWEQFTGTLAQYVAIPF